jgi:2,3,4,5-tetrahydropyridine-2-carboxylate N-succinyltransferase
MSQNLQQIINKAFNDALNNDLPTNISDLQSIKQAVDTTINMLDFGKIKVAEKIADNWQVNQWIKQAILLSFRFNQNYLSKHQSSEGDNILFYDKVKLKFSDWQNHDFELANFRALPGAVVRKGAFISQKVVLMPSFINIGAFIDSGTMIDTWATVGSCAQIGKNCHISGGVGIGGVLEPLQANPVIIEDDCFIGARSEVAEGVIVEQGSVLSMGVYLGASTKIIDRQSGQVFYGRVPAYSVVVPGSFPSSNSNHPALYCAVIVKKVDAKTRLKTSINDLLRD